MTPLERVGVLNAQDAITKRIYTRALLNQLNVIGEMCDSLIKQGVTPRFVIAFRTVRRLPCQKRFVVRLRKVGGRVVAGTAAEFLGEWRSAEIHR